MMGLLWAFLQISFGTIDFFGGLTIHYSWLAFCAAMLLWAILCGSLMFFGDWHKDARTNKDAARARESILDQRKQETQMLEAAAAASNAELVDIEMQTLPVTPKMHPAPIP